MTKKIEPTMYRQGDVLITRVDRLPEITTELPRDQTRGSTVTIPPGDYRVTIHAEYQPGELPRQVAD